MEESRRKHLLLMIWAFCFCQCTQNNICLLSSCITLLAHISFLFNKNTKICYLFHLCYWQVFAPQPIFCLIFFLLRCRVLHFSLLNHILFSFAGPSSPFRSFQIFPVSSKLVGYPLKVCIICSSYKFPSSNLTDKNVEDLIPWKLAGCLI